ncbi:heavy metal-binding domain-containing protein [Tundrisphaera lichenicola]|uniref:heavy metal-binding domain-containing protein n=1 Tax=Tundrisphaera lichenicola TaxID=2029860 RepID=UPI003EC047C0
MTEPENNFARTNENANSVWSHRWGAIGLVIRALQVRLRFVIVLGIACILVGNWDLVRNQVERLLRLVRGSAVTSSSVSSDTEYFCPMDPGVLSNWPGKCGICNMGLVRRKRGEAVPLPSGVVARMQISPYRVQLAGLQTSPIVYRPLTLKTVLIGVMAGPRSIVAQASSRDLAWLYIGQDAELSCDSMPGQTFGSKVKAIHSHEVTLVCDDLADHFRDGIGITATLRRPVAEMEPFRTQPSGTPLMRKGAPRTTFLCPTHANVLALANGKCPVDGKETLQPEPLLPNQQVTWWCPMHPNVRADHSGEVCEECGGMKLVPRVLSYRPTGQVLAVPESAVVDTGEHTVVYAETMSGMFDGVEIRIGPRCGDLFPVISGLEAGMRVATAGTFLIDAETRLNPSLASAYFGAGRKSDSSAEPTQNQTTTTLPTEPGALAEAQKICPVTGKPLGSMGTPVKVLVEGRVVLVCCEGCEGPLLKSPAKYLGRLDAGPPPAPQR